MCLFIYFYGIFILFVYLLFFILLLFLFILFLWYFYGNLRFLVHVGDLEDDVWIREVCDEWRHKAQGECVPRNENYTRMISILYI